MAVPIRPGKKAYLKVLHACLDEAGITARRNLNPGDAPAEGSAIVWATGLKRCNAID